MDNGASSYRRFIDGDESGFTEIVRDYKDGLILYIINIVGDISAAEDIAEDTFVKLGIKKPHFSGNSSFKTWLYAIGRNLSLDHLRRKAKAIEIPLPENEDIPCEESLYDAYLQSERKIALHKAMKRLKKEYRLVLHLIYFEGFSCKEAAKILGKSQHNTEVLISRARRSLKTELETEGINYEDL